jgi:hypothetical protein
MVDQVRVTVIATRIDGNDMRFPHITRRLPEKDDQVEEVKREENKPLPSLYDDEEVDDAKSSDDDTEFDVPAFLRRRSR